MVVLMRINGTLQRHELFASRFVKPRHVDVWLPPSYFRSAGIEYPVIYMHDGQNLFTPATSFLGVDWGVQEALVKLVAAGKVPEAIIIGIWNTVHRAAEYMPHRPFEQLLHAAARGDWIQTHGVPTSDSYLSFVVKELKPFIDSSYRTLPSGQDTFVMGSSMAGLVSLYAICEYPEIFRGAGCISTHWPAGDGVMLRYLKQSLPDPATHLIYFDHGTETLDAEYEPYQIRVDEVMGSSGYIPNRNWVTRKFDGADHSERAWRRRVDIPLAFLLGVYK
jgi:predicted alpha/beta superfamily hydrolase